MLMLKARMLRTQCLLVCALCSFCCRLAAQWRAETFRCPEQTLLNLVGLIVFQNIFFYWMLTLLHKPGGCLGGAFASFAASQCTSGLAQDPT